MTKVFIYEFVTAGGWWSVDASNPPSGSLLNEAAVMVLAVAQDFSALDGIEVITLLDARLTNAVQRSHVHVHTVHSAEDERAKFVELAHQADFVLIIAPEFDGYLSSRVGWAEALNCRLLSPQRAFVELAANKHQTAETLLESGVPAPRGLVFVTGMQIPTWFQWPGVLKPVDGAGSMDVRLVPSIDELERIAPSTRPMRLEEYCKGIAASVSVLCGPRENKLLAAGRQTLSKDGMFRYFGGELPLDAHLQFRAAELAQRTMSVLEKSRGYIGIDLVLGDSSDGSDDYVIEVNPRLTSSYVGLRKLYRQNLAAAMLAITQGEKVELTFSQGPIRFLV